jgi:hypothetical protein
MKSKKTGAQPKRITVTLAPHIAAALDKVAARGGIRSTTFIQIAVTHSLTQLKAIAP